MFRTKRKSREHQVGGGLPSIWFIFLFSSDLSKNSGLKKSILDCFNHNSEEVKSAASYALGNISLGNLVSMLYTVFFTSSLTTELNKSYGSFSVFMLCYLLAARPTV